MSTHLLMTKVGGQLALPTTTKEPNNLSFPTSSSIIPTMPHPHSHPLPHHQQQQHQQQQQQQQKYFSGKLGMRKGGADHGLVNKLLGKRKGRVLGRGTILKNDHYHSLSSATSFHLKDMVCVCGCPCFRSVCEDLKMLATGQPSLSGVKTVIQFLGAVKPKKEHEEKKDVKEDVSVLWINLREEPLVYINGIPHVLREAANPFRNISAYKGLERESVEKMEERIKEDIKQEMKNQHGMIICHDEVLTPSLPPSAPPPPSLDEDKEDEEDEEEEDGKEEKNKGGKEGGGGEEGGNFLTPVWTYPYEHLTSREAWDSLVDEGYDVKYCRVPMSSGEIPTVESFENLFSLIQKSHKNTHIVFNCQSGIGRSTAGLVIGTLVREAIFGGWTNLDNEMEKRGEGGRGGGGGGGGGGGLVGWGREGEGEARRRGEFRVVLGMERLFENGGVLKGRLDYVIDKCSAFVNLREIIEKNVVEAERARTEEEGVLKYSLVRRGLEGYCLLFAFVGYLDDWVKGEDCTFSEWLKERKEMNNIFKELRKKDIMKLIETTGSSAMRTDSISYPRFGEVLTSHNILKADHYPVKEQLPTLVKSALNFRKVPFEKVYVYGGAMPTIEACTDIATYLLASHSNISPTQEGLWVVLREEPLVYVKHRPYVLREASHPSQNVTLYSGITPARVRNMEKRLKVDILREISSSLHLLLHEETENGGLDPCYIAVSPHDVNTLAEMYYQLREKAMLDKKMICMRGVRIPITPERSPENIDYDDILTEILRQKDLETSPIVFNCQMGKGRSTLGMVIACMILSALSRLSPPLYPPGKFGEGGGGGREGREEVDFDLALSICRLLAHGSSVKKEVDYFIDKLGDFCNFREVITASIEKAKISRTAEEADMHTKKAQKSLERYTSLLVYGDYLRSPSFIKFVELVRQEQQPQPQPQTQPTPPPSEVGEGGGGKKGGGEGVYSYSPFSFSGWVEERSEISSVLSQLEQHPHLALRMHHLKEEEEEEKEEEGGGEGEEKGGGKKGGGGEGGRPSVEEVIMGRGGDVLSRGAILKADHFPGCQRKGLKLEVEGAPNLREVEGYGVFGVAIPTVSGVRNTLNELKGIKEQRGEKEEVVVWTNLREEPVIYVSGAPFVLRNIKSPLSNLEHTGIDTNRLEMQEQRLKNDLIRESKKFGGYVLLHDETSDFRLKELWEKVSAESILTPREVYQMMEKEGFQVNYDRVPITDEQAPEDEDFDVVFKRVKNAPKKGQLVFNCQMGRGRTTTGMTVGVMWRSLMGGDHVVLGKKRRAEMNASVDLMRTSFRSLTSLLEGEEEKAKAKAGGGGIEEVGEGKDFKLLKGEFQVVMRLVRVLENGNECKDHTDACLDLCGTMQNLREAIKLYMDRAAAQHDEHKKKHLKTVAKGYLIRYFYLIAFSSFLHTKQNEKEEKKREGEKGGTFEEWVRERKEVSNLLLDVRLK